MSMNAGSPELERIVILTNRTFLAPACGRSVCRTPTLRRSSLSIARIQCPCFVFVEIENDRAAAVGPSPQVPPVANPKDVTSIAFGNRTTAVRGPVTPLSLLLGESLPHPVPSDASNASAGPHPYCV